MGPDRSSFTLGDFKGTSIPLVISSSTLGLELYSRVTEHGS